MRPLHFFFIFIFFIFLDFITFTFFIPVHVSIFVDEPLLNVAADQLGAADGRARGEAAHAAAHRLRLALASGRHHLLASAGGPRHLLALLLLLVLGRCRTGAVLLLLRSETQATTCGVFFFIFLVVGLTWGGEALVETGALGAEAHALLGAAAPLGRPLEEAVDGGLLGLGRLSLPRLLLLGLLLVQLGQRCRLLGLQLRPILRRPNLNTELALIREIDK